VLIYSMSVSVDGFIADREGAFGWTAPSESSERVSVFATTPHKHTQILNKAPDTVVAAIEDVIHESS
jgi:hypothetical protein